MILVDTSAWVAFFRGQRPLADQVDDAIAGDEAAMCGPVATELRRGFKSKADRDRAWPLLEACHWLSQPDDLWKEAGDLGFALARSGVTVKTLDLLIATHALAHGALLLADDMDFAAMVSAGVPLKLA